LLWISAVASQSINDVFSATYDNYLMVGYVTGVETERDLNFRWRVSGADNSSSTYNFQRQTTFSTSSDAARSTNQSSGRITTLQSSVASPFTVDIFRPFAASRTGAFAKSISRLATTITLIHSVNSFDAATSFTGISLIPSGDTITGTVSIYGYSQ
jgi:hypothetical protein